jgi:hypothetical protein
MPSKGDNNVSEVDVKKVESVLKDKETLDQMRRFIIILTLYYTETLKEF